MARIVLLTVLAITPNAWSDDTDRASRGSGRVTIGRPHVLGSMPRELILRIIHVHRGDLVACRERATKWRPAPKGSVKVKFVINSIGIVANAKVVSSTIGNPRLERCLLKAFKRMKFPSTCGGIVIVTVPIVFSSE